MREVCRGLEKTGGGGAGGGGGGGGSGGAAGGGALGGPSTLRFMAYLCLSAFEVRRGKRKYIIIDSVVCYASQRDGVNNSNVLGNCFEHMVL